MRFVVNGDPEVEIVYVATPHSFHCANILMCLEAGKHVLSEKPMVVNAAQAEQVRRDCGEKRGDQEEARTEGQGRGGVEGAER